MANKSKQISDSSLINILPTFHGKEHESIDFYIQQIDAVATHEKWDDIKKFLILRLNLRDKALNYYNENELASKCETFQDLAKNLKSKFSKTLSFEARNQEFSNIKHTPGQSVRELAELIDSKANAYLEITTNSAQEARDLAEKVKLQKFMDSVQPDIRFELKKVAPKEFTKAVQLATNIQNALKDDCRDKNKPSQTEINTLILQQIETNNKINDIQNKLSQREQTSTSAAAQVNAIHSRPNYSRANFRGGNSFRGNRVNKNYPQNFHNKCLICGKNHLTINCWHFPNQFKTRNQNNFRPYSRSRTQSRNFRGRQNFRQNYREQGN